MESAITRYLRILFVTVELLELEQQQEILLIIVLLNVHLLLHVINSGLMEQQMLTHVKFLLHKRLIAHILIQLVLVSYIKQHHAAIGLHQHW
jgi:hypothetical protein